MAHCGALGVLHQDGKLYLLDFGRLYPPESPLSAAQIFPRVAHERAVFFKMLRPGTHLSLTPWASPRNFLTRATHVSRRGAELVGAYEVPLCSDAFTAWLRNDPNASLHNTEVRLRYVFHKG